MFVGGRGFVDCNFIIYFILPLFLVFHGIGGVGGEFAISQLIWEIGVSGARILGGSIRGISDGFFGVRAGVDFVNVIHFLYVTFL